MSSLNTLKIYETYDGEKPFILWSNSIKDPMTRARIQTRLDRIAIGNFGDAKFLGEGVYELRFTFSAGLRIYYGIEREFVVILLLGGDKSSQVKDIIRAKEYWSQYKDLNHGRK